MLRRLKVTASGSVEQRLDYDEVDQ